MIRTYLSRLQYHRPPPPILTKPLHHIHRSLSTTTTIINPPKQPLSPVSPSSPPFSKILIANRGEIACRIIRTCQKLNIPTVALVSPADTTALHATLADEIYPIGTGPEPSRSYLLASDVLTIATQCGASAIHPGYGFLSENAPFATSCKDAGVTFIGPSPEAIRAMGSKKESKEMMIRAGVPCTPGYHGAEQDATYLKDRAEEIGYPVLIKAVAGGGGKGMRIVRSPREFLASLRSCQSESLSSFSDDRVILEKYLPSPRHIEVQILADTHDTTLALHTRDCTLQRRHQKIIEEAPAPHLSREMRERLHSVAVRAAASVGYVNAGTVEFLTQGEEIYFCEMNTRLQVEHPVTEAVTGLDLVEWQLRVAAGEALPWTEVECRGHAFEARVYAEDTRRGFLPAAGRLEYCSAPGDARVDTGVRAGDEVSVYYDPMISKVITWGEDRASALKKLERALQEYHIVGVPTNIPFLQECARHPCFRDGNISTAFLEERGEELLGANVTGDDISPVGTALSAFVMLLEKEGRIGVLNLERERRKRGPWSSLSGSWRNTGVGEREYEFENDLSVKVTSLRDGSYRLTIRGQGDDSPTTHTVSGTLDTHGNLKALVDNKRYNLTAITQKSSATGTTIHLWAPPGSYIGNHNEISTSLTLPPTDRDTGRGHGGGSGSVVSPMPGKVVRVEVAVGDLVEEGQVLMVLEAMKMEHVIKAPKEGVVLELGCGVNEVVGDGVLLCVVGEELRDDTDTMTTSTTRVA